MCWCSGICCFSLLLYKCPFYKTAFSNVYFIILYLTFTFWPMALIPNSKHVMANSCILMVVLGCTLNSSIAELLLQPGNQSLVLHFSVFAHFMKWNTMTTCQCSQPIISDNTPHWAYSEQATLISNVQVISIFVWPQKFNTIYLYSTE